MFGLPTLNRIISLDMKYYATRSPPNYNFPVNRFSEETTSPRS